MTPSRKIYNHSFLYGLGKLKFVDEYNNLVGYKAQTFLEPGYIFAPYLPLIEEPSEFRPRRGLISRYSVKMVNNDYYTTVAVGTP